jgi:hypothetical protein
MFSVLGSCKRPTLSISAGRPAAVPKARNMKIAKTIPRENIFMMLKLELIVCMTFLPDEDNWFHA